MHEKNIMKKNIMQAAAVGIVLAFSALTGLSQKMSIGQSYQSVYVDGSFVGCTARSTDVRKLLLVARREMASETDGRLCMDYTWDLENEKKPFTALLTEEELKSTLKETLKETVIKKKQRVYTVAIEEYRAHFISLDEVTAFLNQVKAGADEDGAYRAVVYPDASHISGVLHAVLEKDEGTSESGLPGKTGMSDAFGDTASFGITAGASSLMSYSGNREAKTVPEGSILEGVTAGAGSLTALAGSSASSNTAGSYETGILNMEFVENVKVYENYVDADMLSDVDEQVVEVTKEKESNKIYQVEGGDCLSVIALDHDTTVSSIVALNGLANADSIKEGQELIIAVPEPDLKLRITMGEWYEEDYTQDPVIIRNDSWYTTKEVVKEEGTPGRRERNDIVVYENGMEVSRELAHENIIVESKAAVIERGTVIPPTYVKPISGGRYTSGFGRRWGRMHKGVDWACPVGTTVYASCGGTVIQASYNGGYGNNVVISHPDGRLTRYAHNSKLLVRVGQTVKQGEAVALSGSTGRSTGPHVHFEIYINGAAVNPLKYINN